MYLLFILGRFLGKIDIGFCFLLVFLFCVRVMDDGVRFLVFCFLFLVVGIGIVFDKDKILVLCLEV